MFKKTSEQLVTELVNANIIKSDDRELYEYGFRQAFTSLLNLITTLALGLAFDCVVQNLVFFYPMYYSEVIPEDIMLILR